MNQRHENAKAFSARAHPGAGRQRGIAAVELAIISPIFLLLIAFTLYLGQVVLNYTAIQHAALDGARYLSTVPVTELGHPSRAAAAASVANAIIEQELAELATGPYPFVVDVTCDGAKCVGYSTPTTVGAIIQGRVESSIFPGYVSLVIPVKAVVVFPYTRK